MKKRSEEVEKIPIRELVDKRIEGKSFQAIADEYGVKKIAIYSYYRECEKTGFGGYDPLGAGKVEKLCRSSHTVEEIAGIFGINKNGMRNYLDDYHVKGRTINLRTVKRLAAEGKTEAYIARYFGVEQQTMETWCKRNGIEIPRHNNWGKQLEMRREQETLSQS